MFNQLKNHKVKEGWKWDLNLGLSDPQIYALSANAVLSCLETFGVIMSLQGPMQTNGRSKSLIWRRRNLPPHQFKDQKYPLNVIHFPHKRLI